MNERDFEQGSDRTLLALFAEIRGSLLRILDTVSEEAATWRVPGLANHIAWHAGHAYVVVEWLTMETLGRSPVAPSGWFELFSWESDPTYVPPEKFPSLATIKTELRSQQQRLRELFASLTPEQIYAPAADQPDRTACDVIVHALQDEAAHKGEICLMRKLHALAHLQK